jgi:IS5 family transposase
VVCDPTNSLVKLADRIDWDGLDETFASLYAEDGRPATATRMMIGLTLLQSLYGLGEDDVVNRWPENPYWQYLCGETFFQHRPPIVRSGLSKWRKRIKSKFITAQIRALEQSTRYRDLRQPNAGGPDESRQES